MTAPSPRTPRLAALLAVLLCGLAVTLAYSNSTQNAFALDDWHTIEQNPYIRHLKFIPRYFHDPYTLTILKPNADYRPLLVTTFALDYAWADSLYKNGLDPRPWHWTNLFMHYAVCVSLFFVGRLLIGSSRPPGLPGLPGFAGDWVSLIAALLFAIHPITTECAQYISTRSSLQVAFFALPALALYLASLARPGRGWLLISAAILYTLALLTKIEAVSLLPVVILAELFLGPSLRPATLAATTNPRRPAPILAALRSAGRGPCIRIAIFTVVTFAGLLLWKHFSPLKDESTRAAAGMTPYAYLCTQFSAWWHYIAHIFAPFGFVADELAYPISRSILDTRAAVSLAGWLLVGLFSLCLVRRAPAVPFCVGAYLLFLAPHSSIVPLAEMVNEHRPYLPVAGLFILIAAGLYLTLARLSRSPLPALAILSSALALPLLALTRERNLVWKDDLSLWSDTVAKSPGSSRAQMNLGLAYMGRGNYAEAKGRYLKALALASGYHYAHTNLAICLAAMGDHAGAAAAHDAAVNDAPGESGPYLWRGRYRAERGDLPGAIDDFKKAASLNPSPYNELACLVEALERAGRAGEAQEWLAKYPPPDPAGFAKGRQAFAARLPAIPQAISAQSQVVQGVALMRQNKLQDAEGRFREAIRLDPANAFAHINMGIVTAAQGKPEGAVPWFDAAARLAPKSPDSFYWRGRFDAQQGDLSHAIASFQAALSLAPASADYTAALAETLLRAGREQESQDLIAKVPAPQSTAVESARAAFRAAVPPKK